MNEIITNSDVSELGLYAGAAGFGIAAGAALAVRGTSDLYRGGKKGKRSGKSDDAIAEEVLSAREKAAKDLGLDLDDVPTEKEFNKMRKKNEKLEKKRSKQASIEEAYGSVVDPSLARDVPDAKTDPEWKQKMAADAKAKRKAEGAERWAQNSEKPVAPLPQTRKTRAQHRLDRGQESALDRRARNASAQSAAGKMLQKLL